MPDMDNLCRNELYFMKIQKGVFFVKRIFVLFMALTMAFSASACSKKEEVVAEEKIEITEEKPSGIEEDGIGEDASFGEGIGQVVPLTDDEKAYVMDKLTNDWLEMNDEEKDDYVSLMARLMEAEKGYIVPDFEEIKLMLDRQSEQYFKNGVNEGVYVTACDILGIK